MIDVYFLIAAIISLLLWKGAYPYEYIDDWEKINETFLPGKENFYNDLYMEDITDARITDYAHAKRVYKDFEIKNLREYHDLHVQSNTLLLVGVFENFHNICLEIYELYPDYFLCSPGLAWQAGFKKTRVKLKTLTDINMLLMVEKGIRGEISHAIHRYAESKNNYMKDYDKNKKSSYVKYWDVNNLYSWAMTQKPPANNFEGIEDSQFNKDFIKSYEEESDKGYFLEVYVQYPEKLHERDNDLLFLPQRMKIEKVLKLVANAHDKTEYVLHLKSLKEALNHGLVYKKLHRINKFNQKSWVKSYIDMNTDLRKIAINDFKKDFFKWMNNAVFGKSMRKHRDVKLVTSEKSRSFSVTETNYHITKFLTENLLVIEI